MHAVWMQGGTVKTLNSKNTEQVRGALKMAAIGVLTLLFLCCWQPRVVSAAPTELTEAEIKYIKQSTCCQVCLF